MRSSLIAINAIGFIIIFVLIIRSEPVLSLKPVQELLFSTSWHPFRGDFGFYPFLLGSIQVTTLAMIISVPLCLLTAIYMSQYVHDFLRKYLHFTIDVLAGIPSVVYGLCGVIVVVPAVSWLGGVFGVTTSGYSLLSGGIVLALMVCPVIIAVCTEVFRMIPIEAIESAHALGTTKWEATKCVVLRGSINGIIAAIVLGFSRAFGETIAVMMVIGNVPKIATSLFDPAYPLPALIANNYGEMMSIPVYDSAMLFAALLLMLVVGMFSLTAYFILSRIERKQNL